MVESVKLQVGALDITGWRSMSFMHSYESLASGFQLSLSDSWVKPPRPIRAGERVQLFIEDNLALTGYIDKLSVEYEAEKFMVRISGRDVLGDLVDCTPPPQQYRDQTFHAIAQDICSWFNIDVIDELGDDTPFTSFSIEPGDTAHQALQELAKQRAALLISNSTGGLVITREQDNPVVATLEEGKDFLKFKFSDDVSKRYSVIEVLGQDTGFGGAGNVKGEASVNPAPRYRPLIILGESTPAGPSLQERADYEIRTRAGIGFRVEIEVPNWGADENSLWSVGDSVRVISPSTNLDTDLLISGVELILSESKKFARLTLARQGSFSILKEPPKDEGAWG